MGFNNSKLTIVSKYQKRIDELTQQCLTCERKCEIKEGKFGYCQTRKNIEGKIHSVVYGCIPAKSCNPIEKKPLYHFFPGTKAYTIGTYGCNFNCFWCQNHHLSHPSKRISKLLETCNYYSPKDFINDALSNKCEGTSISFNEPTLLFEYSLEVFKLAKQEGLYNTYVSNGYMTEKVLQDLVNAGLHAINIDIKGNQEMVKKYCGINNEIIWRNAKIAKNNGVHVEITTLLIEGFNTSKQSMKEIPLRICDKLGKDTPFHISRAFPRFKSEERGFNKPTSQKLLKNAYQIAKDQGLSFVFLGNLYDADYTNTICPNCSEIAIKRNSLGNINVNLDKNGNCNNCGYSIGKL
jgi:pyruvate formate lyase activating enzyme